MPKTYYCDKVRDLKICGENNPQNFNPGRYSTCKNCRNAYVRELNKINKNKEKVEKNNTVDPSGSLTSLITDIVLNIPLIDKKTLSISEKFKSQDQDISDVLITCTSDKDFLDFKKEIYRYIDSKFEELKSFKK